MGQAEGSLVPYNLSGTLDPVSRLFYRVVSFFILIDTFPKIKSVDLDLKGQFVHGESHRHVLAPTPEEAQSGTLRPELRSHAMHPAYQHLCMV